MMSRRKLILKDLKTLEKLPMTAIDVYSFFNVNKAKIGIGKEITTGKPHQALILFCTVGDGSCFFPPYKCRKPLVCR